MPDSIIENSKPVTEMSMEELDAAIAATEVAPSPAAPEAEAKPAGQAETSAPAEAPKSKEAEEIAALRKQLEDSQRFIGRLGNELGQLRKQLAEKTAPPPDPVTPDQVLTNPVEATKKLVDHRLSEIERRKQEELEQIQQQRIATAQFLAQAVPDIIELLPEMAEVALEDGVPKELVERFKTDPLSENPFITVQLAKRAKLNRELKQLRAEREELKAQPKRVIESVTQAAKARPAVSAAHGRSDPSVGESGYTRAQIAKMSDAELLRLIKGDA